MTENNRPGKESVDLTENLPTQRLAQEAKNLLAAFAEKLLASVGDKVSTKVDEVGNGLLEKIGTDDESSPGVKAAVSGVQALNEGKGPLRAALGAGTTGLTEKVKGMFGGGKNKDKDKGKKFLNIVETIDVGVPLRLVYDQWTQYEDFPKFMKKVEHVERPSEEKTSWKAQVFWSHRIWEATVQEQVPDDHIVWRAKGAKGYVDGAVSFSELAPNLTRICLVMEYHAQGLFEHTGNLWRAQGRRARLEFKNFRRYVMAHAILNPDEVEGWRGEIREGEVVKTHEEAMEEEERARAEEPGEPEGRDDEEPTAGEDVGLVLSAEPEEGAESEEGTEPGAAEAGEEREEAVGPGAEDEPEAGSVDEPGEQEGEAQPEAQPMRASRRSAGNGARPRPPRRQAAEDEERPKTSASRRRTPKDQGSDQEDAPSAPARRPRRRPARERAEEAE